MRGELDLERVSVFDAQCLVNQQQMYYQGPAHMFDLVEQFNHRPADFDHAVLTENLANMASGGAAL